MINVTRAKSLYLKTVLPSGLRIVTERIPGVRSASLGVWVTVGSRHEAERENGMSHFIEHLAFKGTSTRSALEIARTIEQGGGIINAFTGKELTCFYAHVLDERLPDAFDVLADILRNPTYDPDELKKEKQVILDEIRDHEDLPDDVAHEFFVKELFAPHPLSRPILGTARNVKSFSRNDVLSFVKSHYRPRRLLVAAAGNVNHAGLVKRVLRSLDSRQKGKPPKLDGIGKLHPGITRHPRPIQQSHMLMGTRALPYGAKDRFALAIMNTVLGGGMSSRLFQNIREKHGIAYSIYSFSESLGDTGFWAVYLATDAARVNRAREMVLDEFRTLCEVPLTAAEIDGVKTQIKGNIMLGLESVSSRMMRLARMELYLGRYHSLEDVSRMIDAVTPRKVQALANQILAEETLVTTIVEPESKAKARRRAARRSSH